MEGSSPPCFDSEIKAAGCFDIFNVWLPGDPECCHCSQSEWGKSMAEHTWMLFMGLVWKEHTSPPLICPGREFSHMPHLTAREAGKCSCAPRGRESVFWWTARGFCLNCLQLFIVFFTCWWENDSISKKVSPLYLLQILCTKHLYSRKPSLTGIGLLDLHFSLY